MAKFDIELPNDLIKQFNKLNENSEKILGEMTKAGAKVVYDNINKNMPKELKKSKISGMLKISKVYKTGSDDGINNKIAFYGPDYYTNPNGQKVPTDLIIKVFEYGRHDKKIPKYAFIRKSFNKAQIEQAMLKVQEKYLPKE